jgi:hypothetical protein
MPTTTPTPTPTGGVPGTTPLGTWPVDLATLPRTSDRDFLAGMGDVATLEYDPTYEGERIGRRGSTKGDDPDRWSVVEGFEAIRCLITLKQFTLTEGPGRPGQTADGRVMFAQAIPADRRNRLVYQDPVYGVRYFYLMGKVEPKKMGAIPHHWFAFLSESPV